MQRLELEKVVWNVLHFTVVLPPDPNDIVQAAVNKIGRIMEVNK